MHNLFPILSLLGATERGLKPTLTNSNRFCSPLGGAIGVRLALWNHNQLSEAISLSQHPSSPLHAINAKHLLFSATFVVLRSRAENCEEIAETE